MPIAVRVKQSNPRMELDAEVDVRWRVLYEACDRDLLEVGRRTGSPAVEPQRGGRRRLAGGRYRRLSSSLKIGA